MNAKQQNMKLSRRQRKIYQSIMTNFPATSRKAALYWALQGGVKFNYQPK